MILDIHNYNQFKKLGLYSHIYSQANDSVHLTVIPTESYAIKRTHFKKFISIIILGGKKNKHKHNSQDQQTKR